MSASIFAQRGRWIIGIIAAAVLGYFGYQAKYGKRDAPVSGAAVLTETDTKQSSDDPNTIEFPRESWQAAGIQLQPVGKGHLDQNESLTGKITLNEDRVAHIYPLVDGRIEEVKVRLGDRVKKGDPLVVIHSTEVGKAMLQLFQDRQAQEFVLTKDHWTREISTNTTYLIGLIRKNLSVEEIDAQLKDKTLGDYREKLINAYIAHNKAKKTYERLSPLAQSGSVPGRQYFDAESELNATQATLQSLLEQFPQDLKQSVLQSEQLVKENEVKVAVDVAQLKILGFDDESLAALDPKKQGETISHYTITAPFEGTVVSKDCVLLERVGPNTQILSIADLSSVWVATDVYDAQLFRLAGLKDHELKFRTPAWPSEVFTAKIFYTGEIIDTASRTIAMRATADNSRGLLKPGLFVNVELQNEDQLDVLRVPVSALQEHEGKTFVFTHEAGDKFMRRDVKLGRRNRDFVEITTGLSGGEEIVTGGGFALKSRLLADLLAE